MRVSLHYYGTNHVYVFENLFLLNFTIFLTLVSGEAPEQPVLSTKSGLVYEKRLILKQISDTGKDPNTGEDLAVEDLIDIQSSRHLTHFATCFDVNINHIVSHQLQRPSNHALLL